MNKEKVFKICISLIAVIIIVNFGLDKSGMKERVRQIKQEKKLAGEKRSWVSKDFGDMELYMVISDDTQDMEMGGNLIALERKSHKYENYSDDISIFMETVEEIKGQSNDYNKIRIYMVYKPEGKYSNLYHYFCFVPFDCDYVTVENKKYITQSGKIKTKRKGIIEFNVCTFISEKWVEKGDVVFHDKSGKEYTNKE